MARGRGGGHDGIVAYHRTMSELAGNGRVRREWERRFGRRDPKIVCVGRNYASHAAESGDEPPAAPLLFGKFANTLCGDGDPIVLPDGVGHVDAEAELAVVVARTLRAASRAEAWAAVAGYTCANDVSAREVQWGDGQWFRGKGFDTFCPVGPDVVPLDDPAGRRIVQRLNGEVLQDASTSDLIFPVDELLAYVSRHLTLEPGDLVLTGTPEGVGAFREPKLSLRRGDVVEVEIDGIGVLRNEVR